MEYSVKYNKQHKHSDKTNKTKTTIFDEMVALFIYCRDYNLQNGFKSKHAIDFGVMTLPPWVGFWMQDI